MSVLTKTTARKAGTSFERLVADYLRDTVDDRIERERLANRIIEGTNGCWEWSGAHLASGYGSLRWHGRSTVVHRVIFGLANEIPEGFQLDHLCRNRGCCNPDHIEAVNQRTNLLRGVGFSAINAAKKSCPSGHAYTPENIYSRPSAPGTRECRICRKANRAKAYAKEKHHVT